MSSESESLQHLALGSNLVLLIPRDDFAKLMDFVARFEQASVGPTGVVLTEDMLFDAHDIYELSRIASDLSQQADAQP